MQELTPLLVFSTGGSGWIPVLYSRHHLQVGGLGRELCYGGWAQAVFQHLAPCSGYGGLLPQQHCCHLGQGLCPTYVVQTAPGQKHRQVAAARSFATLKQQQKTLLKKKTKPTPKLDFILFAVVMASLQKGRNLAKKRPFYIRFHRAWANLFSINYFCTSWG